MGILTIVKIEGNNAHNNLQDFLLRQQFLPSFFFSPYTLNTYFTNNGKNLYIATQDEQETLIMSREKPKEIRFFFTNPPITIKEAIFDYFKPIYSAVNEVINPPKEVFALNRLEVKLFLPLIADLSDKNIRKEYNQCKRKHPNLRFEQYNPEHIKKIRLFIEKWNIARIEKTNKFMNTENDLHFFKLYNYNPGVIGGVVMDGNDIIGISFAVPSLNGGLISVINKSLRGYTELGVFIYVERARFLCDKGFNRVHIGSVSNDFKKQFLREAIFHDIYSYELYKASNFKSSEWHLLNLF